MDTNLKRRLFCNIDDLDRDLSRYKATSPTDQANAERILKAFHTIEDPFSRNTLPGHFTASAWVANSSGDQIVLLLHKKLGLWLQPGGHADGDSDLLAVARREAFEECGLSNLELAQPGIFHVDVHKIPAFKNEASHYHYDVCYAFQDTSGEVLKVSDESREVKWVPLSKLSSYTEDKTITEMSQKWKSGRSHKTS